MPEQVKKKSKFIAGITWKRIVVWIVIFVLLAVYLIYQNNSLRIREEIVQSKNLPSAFDGFKIVHISDLHEKEFGENHSTLIGMIKECNPDIIVITGDLIDFQNTYVERSLNFVKGAIDIAPIYYVNGNHESRVSEYKDLRDGLLKLGVTVLENQTVQFEKDGEQINITGLIDTDFPDSHFPLTTLEKRVRREMEPIFVDEGYTLLLAHRPEYFPIYAEFGADLALTGHAHGGQVRLPFTDGLFAPAQGVFPKYTSGPYRDGDTTMIVSKGIGNSTFPFRVNNPPEIVSITLKCE